MDRDERHDRDRSDQPRGRDRLAPLQALARRHASTFAMAALFGLVGAATAFATDHGVLGLTPDMQAPAIFVVIVILALVVVYAGSRTKIAGPDEALIRIGRSGRIADSDKVVRGPGHIVVLPFVHQLGRLSLTARQIRLGRTDAVTSQGVKVAIESEAAYKVGDGDTSVRHAAERYLRTDIRTVDDVVRNILEGSLRSIVGTLTVEEFTPDPDSLQQAVQSAASADLEPTGLTIDNFTIGAITADE